MITHIVVFWTDKPNESGRAKLLAGAEQLLQAIPGVDNFRYGAPVPSPRAAVDDSFAMAISMDFADQAAADTYQSHPNHVRFIEEYVKPLSKRFLVYDFAL